MLSLYFPSASVAPFPTPQIYTVNLRIIPVFMSHFFVHLNCDDLKRSVEIYCNDVVIEKDDTQE